MVNFRDPRSMSGILSRGSNVYRGGSNSPTNNQSSQRTYTPPGGFNRGQSRAPGQTNPAPSTGVGPGWGGRPFGGLTGSLPSTATEGPQVSTSIPGNPHSPSTSPQTYEQIMQQIMSSLPGLSGFNAPYEDLMNQLQTQMGGLDITQGRETERLDNMYNVILQRLQENLGQSLEQNNYSMADQGILQSGINVREQGRINENFAQQGADIQGQHAADLEGLLQQISSARNELQQQQQWAEIQRAQQEQQAQQQQAMIAAQAASAIYSQQLMGQQPTPNSTGQYVSPTTQGTGPMPGSAGTGGHGYTPPGGYGRGEARVPHTGGYTPPGGFGRGQSRVPSPNNVAPNTGQPHNPIEPVGSPRPRPRWGGGRF